MGFGEMAALLRLFAKRVTAYQNELPPIHNLVMYFDIHSSLSGCDIEITVGAKSVLE